jgi:cytochrome c oxidase assembly protein subunit 15
VEASAERLGRVRRLELSPGTFQKLAIASAGSLYLIVVTGALVRLTASGLGCDSWPGCENGSFLPEQDVHGAIEFGNRAVGLIPISLTLATALAARRVRDVPRWAVWLAAAVAAGTFAQAPLGLITITSGLHPLLVMSHFLLALVVLAGGIVLALTPWRIRSVPRPPLFLSRLGLVLAGTALALVVSGTFATAAGPHPGDSAKVRRLGTLYDSVYVHVRVTALFGCVFLFVLGYLASRREEFPRLFRGALALLGLLIVQMAVGELQYRTELPWGLVLVHVALAAAVWAGTVAFVTLLWLPAESAPRAGT